MLIHRIIEWSDRNRVLVALGLIALALWGFWSLKRVPLDAIPDLSDTQVIVFTEWPGRSPDLVEDQITYPIVSSLVAAPKVKTARGVSFFGLSFVYVLFEDDTDIYWARSRVLEYMSKVGAQLPQGVTPTLGPDATGVGWGFQYVLEDTTGSHTLQELRTFQDWYLRYWLESVPGVAEVASVGGFVKQYQVTVDPVRLLAHDIPLSAVVKAVQASNNDVGGRTVEMSGREYIVRGRGYVEHPRDLEEAVVTVVDGVPIRVADLGEVKLGPEVRRGAADWNGQGEVVGGVVVVRFGENVLDVVARVKDRIAELESSLPQGVKVRVAYDRTDLIQRSIDTLSRQLIEESLVVALVVAVFLWHLPSALVAILVLPLAILLSFIPMRLLGISSNIMSLGGIAIAIGAMVDAAIVLVENAHKKIEKHPDRPRREVILEAAKEVGPALFFSLLIITVSFLPVFALEAQEGRLFHPLAYTKTFSMAWAAVLTITVTPPLMVLLLRGRIVAEDRNPLNRFMIAVYQPIVRWVLRHRRVTLLSALLVLVAAVPLYRSLGSEFMPPLNEGSILYMPTTLPGVSITEAQHLMQQQDKAIAAFPEVESVFGKVGRARTPTDPAPLSMIETTIVLKPESQWREGMTWEKLIDELDEAVKLPGVTNAWTMPIKGRIDMLTTGIRTPVGIKVLGNDLAEIEGIGRNIEAALSDMEGTRSVYAERVMGGSFIDFTVDRHQAARYGLNVEEVEMLVETAIGGMNIDTTVEGPERYPVNIRYYRDYRSDLDSLERILVPTPSGAQVPIGMLTDVRLVEGAPAIRNENGAKTGWVFIDVAGSDIGGYVEAAKAVIAREVEVPPGYTLLWSGQYENMLRARERLSVVVPVTLLVVFLLLYLSLQDVGRAAIVFLSLPFAVTGSLLYLWLADYNMSVAVWVGMIALVGLAAETGVVMLVYLDEAWKEMHAEKGDAMTVQDLEESVVHGAVQRVRPKIMTVATTVLGLMPILWASGTGADTMKRIAAPMVGGMVSSTLLTLVIIPAVYAVWRGRSLKADASPAGDVTVAENS